MEITFNYELWSIYVNLMFQYCRTFIDRHYGQPTEIVENLYFLQNVNLTKTIRLRIRKAYFLGNKLLLFSMWNVKHISRFRTLWKCRWIWSLPINQMLKTRCFRRVELGGSIEGRTMRESGIQLGIRMSMGGYGWWGMEGRWIQDFLLQTNSYASPLNTLGQASGPHPLSQHKLPSFLECRQWLKTTFHW